MTPSKYDVISANLQSKTWRSILVLNLTLGSFRKFYYWRDGPEFTGRPAWKLAVLQLFAIRLSRIVPLFKVAPLYLAEADNRSCYLAGFLARYSEHYGFMILL